MINQDDNTLITRINKYPNFKDRVEALLDVIENTHGQCIKASDAEQRVIEEVRKMGSTALHGWAGQAVEQTTAQLRAEQIGLEGNGKKKVWWHTTFGVITVEEPIFRNEHQQFRPFCTLSEITPRCCSLPLQRVATDFGADQAFGRVPQKLKEHYGIDLPVSTIRDITLHHAEKMYEQQETLEEPEHKAAHQLIAEMDGSMIPVVTVNENADDKRKDKTLHWQEGRLCLAHALGSTTVKYGAVFNGSVTQAGEQLFRCALLVGFDKDSRVHGIGDGAVWLERQVSDKFGEQGSYLVDFYHICEYLGAAANSCNFENASVWTTTQKEYLKNNELQRVFQNLKPHLEADDIKDEKAPVRLCYRYLTNRTGQLDYKTAIDQGLPIGSGEIESAHRYIIQERLKLPGAWWKPTNVSPMLALRVVRANKQWESYWQNVRKAA